MYEICLCSIISCVKLAGFEWQKEHGIINTVCDNEKHLYIFEKPQVQKNMGGHENLAHKRETTNKR